jgi:hypothetical protein
MVGRPVWFPGVPPFLLEVFVFEREPVVAGFAGLDVVVLSVLGLSQVFGLFEFSVEQNAAVTAFVVAVSGLIASFVRNRVMPVERFEEFRVAAVDYADEAFAAGFEGGLVSLIPDDLGVLGDAEGS